MSIKKCKYTGNIFEYTDGEEYKCYTCMHRHFRGRTDYCSMKQKILTSEPGQGCKSGWSRRYKSVH